MASRTIKQAQQSEDLCARTDVSSRGPAAMFGTYAKAVPAWNGRTRAEALTISSWCCGRASGRRCQAQRPTGFGSACRKSWTNSSVAARWQPHSKALSVRLDSTVAVDRGRSGEQSRARTTEMSEVTYCPPALRRRRRRRRRRGGRMLQSERGRDEGQSAFASSARSPSAAPERRPPAISGCQGHPQVRRHSGRPDHAVMRCGLGWIRCAAGTRGVEAGEGEPAADDGIGLHEGPRLLGTPGSALGLGIHLDAEADCC
jgi:hypothetical protein